VCRLRIDFFVRLTVSIVEKLKLSKFRFPVTELQVTHVARVWLDLCIPFYGGRSKGVPFLRKFFVRLNYRLPLQGFECTHPIFDDVANVANGEACTKLVH